jgi:hypothetical protein
LQLSPNILMLKTIIFYTNNILQISTHFLLRFYNKKQNLLYNGLRKIYRYFIRCVYFYVLKNKNDVYLLIITLYTRHNYLVNSF